MTQSPVPGLFPGAARSPANSGCTPGTCRLRHFRVEDAGLVEIDCYGPLPGQEKPAAIGTQSGGTVLRQQTDPLLQRREFPAPLIPGARSSAGWQNGMLQGWREESILRGAWN